MISVFSRDDQGQYHITQDMKCWSKSMWKRKAYSRIVVTMRPDGRAIAVSAENQRIRVFEMGASGRFQKMQKLDQKARMMASSPDGEYLVSITEYIDGKVQVWKGFDTPKSRMSCVDEKHVDHFGGSIASAMAFSSDGRLALILSYQVIVCALDRLTETLEPTQVLPSDSNSIETLAWTSDGRTLAASGGSEGHVQIWTTGQDGQMRQTAKIDQPIDYCRRLCFSPDGNLLAAAYGFQGWCMWKRDQRGQDGWSMVLNCLDDGWDPKGIAFHPDGQSIVRMYMEYLHVWSIGRE